jgi:hypothetical protein
MKNRKDFLLLCTLLCISVHITAASETELDLVFEKPSTNPTITGQFNEIMNSIHAGMNYLSSPCLWFLDYNTYLGEHTFRGTLAAGTMLPILPNLAIPVFGNFAMNFANFTSILDDPKKDTLDGMLGGGLLIYGRFGLLAGYAGYNMGQERYYDGSRGDRTKDYEKSWEKVQWAVFPLINAKEYPLLNSFVQLIDGFFSLDNLRMGRDEFKPSYKANVLFKGIPLGRYEKWKMFLGTYTQKDWYNFNAKYELYAGKLDLVKDFDYDNIITFSLEAGYRRFFDIFDPKRNNQYYEDGVYSKIAFKWFFEIFSFTFYMESGSTAFFNTPTIGLLASFGYEKFVGNFLTAFGKDATWGGTNVNFAMNGRGYSEEEHYNWFGL